MTTEAMQFSVRIETFNKNKAECAIAQMTDHQRSLSESAIRNLQKEMELGRFGLSNDALVRTQSGIYLNGQHRLYAVARSNTEQTFIVLIVPDNDRQITKIMDCGTIRSIAHVLQSEHKASNATTIQGAPPLILGYKRRLLTVEGNYASTNRTAIDKFVTRSEKIAYAKAHLSQLSEGAALCKGLNQKYGLIGPGRTLALWMLACESDSAKSATSFIECLYSGHGQNEASIEPLRRAIIRNASQRQKYCSMIIFASLITTYKSWKQGTVPSNAIIRKGSTFPIIRES